MVALIICTDSYFSLQITQINDCLYRFMYTTQYIAFLDVDELIVPRQEVTSQGHMTRQEVTLRGHMIRQEVTPWGHMLHQINQQVQNETNVCAYSFRQNLFRLKYVNWKNLTEQPIHPLVVKYRITSLALDIRDAVPWPHYQRSKLIVNARKIVLMAIHVVTQPLRRQYLVYKVENTTAALHHYRSDVKYNISDGMYTLILDQSIGPDRVRARDNTVQHFARELIENINKTNQKVNRFIP